MGGLGMAKYFKGDDFDAFDQEWALVEADIPEDWVVTKAELKIGILPTLVFKNPEFPFSVTLNHLQTSELKDVSTCYMAIYDEKGRKQTLEGSWTFTTENEVVDEAPARNYFIVKESKEEE